MPMPRAFRSLSRVLNPVVRPLAGRLPPLALVHHTGRRTGRAYSTPVMAFPTGAGWVIALAYGSDVQWLRNAEHAGGADLTRAGRRHRAAALRRVPAAEAAGLLPAWARAVMRLADVRDYLVLTPA
ncbi:nitroreductase family deazaflavin-dependent oxidoreductase [Streptomonospora nanhaiensis]|uniref:Deazaflavin-dependent oxidoreductase (Nitroreductase family) n=1 Tax=Streptomonospora nanhaiensis TaxID=1323731 RepID=A0A853BNF2_9ACTN|nr:nitroreductase family deazaflavin-dependent oxidoreductase [Streptomonospora nanhaiensis]MBV2362030.1 nitroreductase family deazaflavin-dependent oxidoreductase [Streptomonospora nanhaiensis]MBX9386738.1 nitroreductase family deazaflavin-dependent oxidoreductase [Streptomonospora nanhaiensis]NYI96146.1 deazaflavin-dependent oxidoreductase (nitroreductase family) [Streptomonospora nanhaiensis]